MFISRKHTFITVLLVLAVIATAIFAFALTLPTVAEANHCGSKIHHPGNGECYTASAMCNAGWTEYCEEAEEEEPVNCPAGEAPDGAGNCFSYDELCAAGYGEYCENEECPSNRPIEQNGNCYTETEMCNAGWTQYCSGGGNSGGGGGVSESLLTCAEIVYYGVEVSPNVFEYRGQTCERLNQPTSLFPPEIHAGNLYRGDGEPCGYETPYKEYMNEDELIFVYVYETIPEDECYEEEPDADPPTTEPTDVCPNLSGTQTSVPNGYYLNYNHGNSQYDGAICSQIPEGCSTQASSSGKGGSTTTLNCPENGSDVCPNLSGTQTSVPTGYQLVGGNCVPNNNEPGDENNDTNDLNEDQNGQEDPSSGSNGPSCSNICVGGNVVNSCTGTLVETCSFSCGSGICIPPPSPELLSWTVLPLLVHRGDEVTLSWNTQYTERCTVERSNGTPFTGLNSSGTRTDTVTQETTYVLSCLGLDETSLTSPSKTVRIVPDWQEI